MPGVHARRASSHVRSAQRGWCPAFSFLVHERHRNGARPEQNPNLDAPVLSDASEYLLRTIGVNSDAATTAEADNYCNLLGRD